MMNTMKSVTLQQEDNYYLCFRARLIEWQAAWSPLQYKLVSCLDSYFPCFGGLRPCMFG